MKIELTNQEALVLFEWLCQNSEKDELFAHEAEQYVLWRMEAQLDKALLDLLRRIGTAGSQAALQLLP